MNGTLLLRLAGPLQSWGDARRHRVMGTRDEPIMGLIFQARRAAKDRKVEESEAATATTEAP